jgi:hypothetical protein
MRQRVRSDLMEMAVDIREEYVTESNWSDRSRVALKSKRFPKKGHSAAVYA